MPNEVYDAAVAGLGALVSPRVARRIVDDALHATNRTPDDVSRSAMRRLLLGRIRKDLEGVMPAGAVGPGLKHLAATLDDPTHRDVKPWWRGGGRPRPAGDSQSGKTAAGDSRAGKAQPGASWSGSDAGGDGANGFGGSAGSGGKAPLAVREIGVTRSSVYLPDVPLPDLEQPGASPALPGGAAPATTGASPAATASATAVVTGAAQATAARPIPNGAPAVARPPAPAGAPLPELTQALVERALRVFADLETVRQVVAVKRGIVLLASGVGVDPERLQGLSVAITGLLSKAGTLRVFSLEHEAGVLFVFPMKDGAIVVLTRPKVNLGAVLSARATLEEAA